MSKYNYFIEEGGVRYQLRETRDVDANDTSRDLRDTLVDYEYTTKDGITKRVEWPAYIIALPKEELPKPEHNVVECKDCDEYGEAIKELEDEDRKRLTSRD